MALSVFCAGNSRYALCGSLGSPLSGLISTNGVPLPQVRDSGDPEEGSGGHAHGPQPASRLPCQSVLDLNIAPRNLALCGCFCHLSRVNLEPLAMSSGRMGLAALTPLAGLGPLTPSLERSLYGGRDTWGHG